MFKEDIEWFISVLRKQKDSLYIEAAWKKVPMYGYTGAISNNQIEIACDDEEEINRRKKMLDIEIRKWEVQLDFYPEKNNE